MNDKKKKEQVKGKRGFASMDPVKQAEIAASGGRAAHKKGTAHKWNAETAGAAGRIGGRRAQELRRAKRDQEERTTL
jgi:general stress protein YciG